MKTALDTEYVDHCRSKMQIVRSVDFRYNQYSHILIVLNFLFSEKCSRRTNFYSWQKKKEKNF